MKENRNIPLKNYIILSLVLIFTIIFVIYFYMWYGEIRTAKLSDAIIDDYLTVINYNELDNYLVENKDVILYVSMLNDSEIRNFELKFKNIIREYDLNEDILYLDLTEQYNNKNTFNKINNKYGEFKLPCIIIFNNGEVSDIYSIKEKSYDLDLLVSYLRIKGVIYD